MVGELRKVRTWLLAVQRLERLERKPVQADAAGGREPFVERVADQDVRETQTTRAPGNVGHDTGGHCLVERVQQIVFGDIRYAGECVEAELAPEHAGEREHPVRLIRQVTQPSSDDVADALWDEELRGVSLIEASLFGEQSHDLADEQRIALGFLVDDIDEISTRSLGRNELDEFRYRAVGQPGKPETFRCRLPDELRQRTRQRLAGAWVDVTARTDDEQAAVLELARKEL